MAPPISVRNLQRGVRVDIAALRKAAGQILEMVARISRKTPTPLQKLEEISVLLISDKRMAGLHRQFLHRDGPTDVITFDHGEIFISAETARRQAKQFGSSLADELQLYVIHGLLHLHGFDDGDSRDAREMKRTQEKIMVALK